MVQNRIYDFGALLTQKRAKTFATSLFSPGLYGGLDPIIISGTQLEFGPGTYLLPNGVLMVEDANVPITIPTPPTPQDYTVVVNHDDIQATGGSPALYSLVPGILGRAGDPNPNSLAILWIRHTGGGPLTTSMLSRPPTLQAGTLLSAVEDGFIAAPFPFLCDEVKDPNIVVTQQTRSVRFGTGAVTSASGATVIGQIDVTGLTGMSLAYVGRYMKFSGGAGPNNGWFQIVAFVSATAVRITDNGTAPGTEAALVWDVREPESNGLQVINTAVSGLQTYRFRIPLPSRPQAKSIEVYGDIASLATISINTHPYRVFARDRAVISATPTKLTGLLSGVDPGSSPAGTFVLGNYDETNAPTSLGVTLEVPAQTSGIFIRGFNLVGD